MKSKRRHELQTNDLADRIGHFIEQVRPYATTILMALVAVAVAISAWYYLASNRERQQADAWRAYFAAGSNPQGDMSTQLSAVADSYAGTPAGLWSAQTAADLTLAQGIQLMFADRAQAETNIDRAKGLYKQVLDDKLTQSYPMLLERARFGMAQACEAMNDLEDAKKYYELVGQAAPQSALGKAALKRLDKLVDPDTEKWYNWFARQEAAPPTPDTPSSPLGGSPLGSGMPSLGGLPDLPELDSSPDTGGDKNESDTSTDTGTPPPTTELAPPDNSAADNKEPAKKADNSKDVPKKDATKVDQPSSGSKATPTKSAAGKKTPATTPPDKQGD